MIEAVLWDIDGTLLDSEPYHFNVNRRRLRGPWPDGSPSPNTTACSAAPWRKSTPCCTPYSRCRSICRGSRRPVTDYYVTHVADVPARAGALEKVAELAERGVLQACVSNSGRRVVEANIGAIAMPEALRFALSRDDVTHGKPHPEPYLRAAERLGVPPFSLHRGRGQPDRRPRRQSRRDGHDRMAAAQDAGVRPGRSPDRRTERPGLACILPPTVQMSSAACFGSPQERRPI